MIKGRNSFKLLMVIGLCVFAHVSFAVVYVDGSKAGGNGTSWAQAYRTIEAAVNASGSGQEIWVARGTYTPNQPINLRANTRMYGGFAGTEVSLNQRNLASNATVVDGQNSLVHVMVIESQAPGCLVDGFHIRRGRAQGSFGWNSYGGGIFVNLQPATIANCSFSNNSAVVYGGAIFVNRASVIVSNCVFVGNSADTGGAVAFYDQSPQLLNCRFIGNVAAGGNAIGGGLWMNLGNILVSGCEFNANQANYGGGISFNNMASALVRDSSFGTNSGTLAGGGIANNLGTITVSNCSFRSNSTGGEGGGLYSYYTPAYVYNSTFRFNSALNGGGLMLDYKIANHISVVDRCLFAGNTATAEGGGMHSFARSVNVDNSLFTYNNAPNGAGARVHAGLTGDGSFNNQYTATFRNSLFYGNTATQYGGALLNSFASALRLYNCISWGNAAGTTIWDPGRGQFVTTPDVFNSGSGSLETRRSIIQTLTWNHGSVSESHTGSLSSNPLFQSPLGTDGQPATADDNFRLQSTSPALDRADANQAPALDYEYNPRFDQAGAANNGLGSPNFVDVGPYERIQYAANPTFSPGTGTYSSWRSVTISSATPGSRIYYTTNGSTPSTSSATNLPVIVNKTTVIRAMAVASGFANSDISSATFSIVDTDGDGLPNWMENDSGNFLSSTNTGTDPLLFDTDGDLVSDGIEVTRGTNPNDPLSVPPPVSNDFDGDRKSDIGCYFPPGGNWYLSIGSALVTNQFGYAGTIPVTGDFDGDGVTDFGCYDPAGIPNVAPPGSWYILQSSNGFRVATFGYANTVPFVGDFDGDGRDDFGCYDAAGIPNLAPPGSWYILQSSNGFRTATFGYPNTVPVVGDFDGDGRDDFGCYDAAGIPNVASPGSWYLMQSRNGFRTATFGYANTVPVVGDFDGDSKDDFGCYDAAGIPNVAPPGSWYILQSRDGFRTATFGYANTVPVVGDYDGDGRDDYGCYDAAGIPNVANPGSWYILQSSAGFKTFRFGFDKTIPLGK